MELNLLTERVIGAAIEVHKQLGPGLLESTYEACLAYELREHGLKIETQTGLPVKYKGVQLEVGYRLDILVEEVLLLEIKAVEQVLPVHRAQVLTYLKLSGLNLALLINFNTPLLKDGITRLAYQLPS